MLAFIFFQGVGKWNCMCENTIIKLAKGRNVLKNVCWCLWTSGDGKNARKKFKGIKASDGHHFHLPANDHSKSQGSVIWTAESSHTGPRGSWTHQSLSAPAFCVQDVGPDMGPSINKQTNKHHSSGFSSFPLYVQEPQVQGRQRRRPSQEHDRSGEEQGKQRMEKDIYLLFGRKRLCTYPCPSITTLKFWGTARGRLPSWGGSEISGAGCLAQFYLNYYAGTVYHHKPGTVAIREGTRTYFVQWPAADINK